MNITDRKPAFITSMYLTLEMLQTFILKIILTEWHKWDVDNLVLLISFVVVQLLSPGQLFATPWAAAHQAPLSFTVSRSLLRFKEVAKPDLK